jgi:hypothetical protein
MDNTDNGYSTKKLILRVNDQNDIVGSGKGRRSGKDRRKLSRKKYFIDGGLERRGWKERRKNWYIIL